MLYRFYIMYNFGHLLSESLNFSKTLNMFLHSVVKHVLYTETLNFITDTSKPGTNLPDMFSALKQPVKFNESVNQSLWHFYGLVKS